MDEREQLFQNPGIKYRSKPFWAWNGELEEQELYRQMDVMKEMGFGGAFMHSRVGLETEYLGKKWMELTEKCLAYGEKIGLDLWLYDEDRWPSGSAGGMVTEKKENRSQHLQLHILEPEEAGNFIEKNKEKIVRMLVGDVQGHEYENLQEYQDSAVLEMAGKEGSKKVLAVTIEESVSSDNYNGYTYLDTLKGSAVEDYLASTHDKYKKEISPEVAGQIKGVFTDEPHRGSYLADFSEGNGRAIPYTDELFSLFKETYGYDLKENLEDLFLRKKGQTFSKVASDYVELAQELFLKNFMEKIHNRCQEYGWDFTGHLLHEDLLCAQTCMLGSLMTGYEYMDIPGIDLLGEDNNCWWIGKQLSSVAHQLDKKGMLTELFGCTGWQMKFEDYKSIGDWQAMMGINLFCPHLSWYTMKGENKRDYPSSIFYQSGWYKQYSYVEDYFARIHVTTEGKPSDCRLLVMNPIESVWARTYSGCFKWLSSNDEGISAIEKQYQETFVMLMEAGIDFDYGDERILARHGSVENGKLRIGSCVYEKVLLSGMETMKESTWKLLKEFADQGGEILIAGKAPEMIKAVQDMRVSQLVRAAKQIPFTKESLMENCQPEKPLYKLDSHGQRVFIQSYQLEDGISFILLNMDRKNGVKNVTLSIAKEGQLEVWNARTGEIESVKTVSETDADGQLCQTITFDLVEEEEKIFVLRQTSAKEEVAEAEKEPTCEKAGEVLAQKDFAYTLSEDNVAVLDNAAVYLDGKCLTEAEDPLKADRIVRDALGYSWRGGEMMQPWYVRKYYPERMKQRNEVRAEYYFDAEVLPEKLLLAAEMDDTTKLYLNDQLLTKEEGFWIDPAYSRFPVAKELLKSGRNKVSIVYSYGTDSGLENLYLVGSFGVKLKGTGKQEVCLTALPERLKAGDILEQMLPFYTGSISYELDQPMEGEVEVSLEKMPGALVIFHGEEDKISAFAPYNTKVKGLKAIEVVFSRRNTFGPLHLPKAYRGSIGPDHFLTNGENWCDEMQLLPQGLPETIYIKK